MTETIISVLIGVSLSFIALIPVFIMEINHRKRMKEFDNFMDNFRKEEIERIKRGLLPRCPPFINWG